jgi:hydrogenase/urease accessory protein HupE
MSTHQSRLGIGVVVIALTCGATALRAHEIGTTQVTITIDLTGAYDVEVNTDAAALAEKLETVAGRTLPADSSAAQLLDVLTRDQALLRQRLHLTFDDVEVQPAISISVVPASDPLSPPAATIHLTGKVPASASRLTWRYGWTFASYSLTVRGTTGTGDPVWLEGGEQSSPIDLRRIAPPPTRIEIVRRYLVLGFTHILPLGFDHVLFVLGIYLLSRQTRAMLWQVSAFTLAHSITLGLSMFGMIAAPPRLVEPMIALSIAYIAIENVFLSRLRPWRVALVFAFGLLHGMGFAGALKEIGLPRSELLTALVSFNLGVEAGQLTVIGLAATFVGWYCRHKTWYRSRVVVPASLAIAVTALYWTVERLAP